MTRRTLLVFLPLTFVISRGVLALFVLFAAEDEAVFGKLGYTNAIVGLPLVGVVWALWHVPAFFLSGTPQGQWSLPRFWLGCVTLSLILTPMFNAARDSVIFAGLAAALVAAQRDRRFKRGAGATAVLSRAPQGEPRSPP